MVERIQKSRGRFIWCCFLEKKVEKTIHCCQKSPFVLLMLGAVRLRAEPHNFTTHRQPLLSEEAKPERQARESILMTNRSGDHVLTFKL